MWAALKRIFGRSTGMSAAWMSAHAREETKAGWEGPRWRFQAEVQENQRAEAQRERWRRAAEKAKRRRRA